MAWQTWQEAKENEAVILLSPKAITLDADNTAKNFNWREVQEASITNDEGTQYLLLPTIYGDEKIGISRLDKSLRK